MREEHVARVWRAHRGDPVRRAREQALQGLAHRKLPQQVRVQGRRPQRWNDAGQAWSSVLRDELACVSSCSLFPSIRIHTLAQLCPTYHYPATNILHTCKKDNFTNKIFRSQYSSPGDRYQPNCFTLCTLCILNCVDMHNRRATHTSCNNFSL